MIRSSTYNDNDTVVKNYKIGTVITNEYEVILNIHSLRLFIIVKDH